MKNRSGTTTLKGCLSKCTVKRNRVRVAGFTYAKLPGPLPLVFEMAISKEVAEEKGILAVAFYA